MKLSLSQRLYVYTNMRDFLKRKLDAANYNYGFCRIFNRHFKATEGEIKFNDIEYGPMSKTSAVDWFDALPELRDIGFRVTKEQDSYGLACVCWEDFSREGCMKRIAILDEAIIDAMRSQYPPKEESSYRIKILFDSHTTRHLSIVNNLDEHQSEFSVPVRTAEGKIEEIACVLGYDNAKIIKP